MHGAKIVALAAGAAGIAAAAGAYPGGTPTFQTDAAPYCASCHSSLSEEALAGAGERAAKELAANKHLATILAGQGAYADLGEADRQKLAEYVRAVDAASTIELETPPRVAPGETLAVTVKTTGGAGPALGVALVDAPHRWYARPASAVGWQVASAPTVIADGKPQSTWIEKRPENLGRALSFVNVTGVQSDAVLGKWAETKIVFTLRAPDRPGDYPLVAAYFYGTEKASPLGTKMNPLGFAEPRGGFTGNSGRVVFTPVRVISVRAE
jgi:hypothetical protein